MLSHFTFHLSTLTSITITLYYKTYPALIFLFRLFESSWNNKEVVFGESAVILSVAVVMNVLFCIDYAGVVYIFYLYSHYKSLQIHMQILYIVFLDANW